MYLILFKCNSQPLDHSDICVHLDPTVEPEASSEYTIWPNSFPSHEMLACPASCGFLTDWERLVHDNIQLLVKNPTETLWPRDTMFRYLLLMESLQENLQERQDLLDLSCKLKNMHGPQVKDTVLLCRRIPIRILCLYMYFEGGTRPICSRFCEAVK